MEETESSRGIRQFTGHEGSLFHKSLCPQAKHRAWATASSDLGELKRIKVWGSWGYQGPRARAGAEPRHTSSLGRADKQEGARHPRLTQ